MTDEEKKAIEMLRNYDNKDNLHKIHQSINVVLNLIEKQQKEIEELKEYKQDAELTKVACCSAQNCEALNNCIKLTRELQNADKKWKDKIKAKIEDLKENSNGDDFNLTNVIMLFKSLLEKE